jgi:hypothetical protein
VPIHSVSEDALVGSIYVQDRDPTARARYETEGIGIAEFARKKTAGGQAHFLPAFYPGLLLGEIEAHWKCGNAVLGVSGLPLGEDAHDRLPRRRGRHAPRRLEPIWVVALDRYTRT